MTERMRRFWEKLGVLWLVVWSGVAVRLAESTRWPLPGAAGAADPRRLRGALQYYYSTAAAVAAAASSSRRGIASVELSDVSAVRSLLELETSSGERHNAISHNWLIAIVVLSATAVVGLAIAILLLRQCLRHHWKRRRDPKSSSMLMWTNQLSSLQHPAELSGSENNSRRGSRRSELATLKGLAMSKRDGGRSNSHHTNSKQGQREFQREVDLMSKIRHPNLVALLGNSNDGPKPSIVGCIGSLHDQLHGPTYGKALNWHVRLKVALEAARGLEHLHEHCKPPIIHRDFKASNILLDAYFNVKVAGFGLAIALEEGGFVKEDEEVQRTIGYIAPEYLMFGILTEKIDVYGFGVVLLELLTGKLPIDASLPLGFQSLVTWATPLLKNRAKLMEILDPSLHDSVNENHLHHVAAVAVLCVQAEASYRPLIAEVVQSLLPLIPQELGGSLPPQTNPGLDEHTSQKIHCGEALAVELQSFNSQRSDSSAFSLELFPKSPGSLDSRESFSRIGSWENVTRSSLEGEGQGTCPSK